MRGVAVQEFTQAEKDRKTNGILIKRRKVGEGRGEERKKLSLEKRWCPRFFRGLRLVIQFDDQDANYQQPLHYRLIVILFNINSGRRGDASSSKYLSSSSNLFGFSFRPNATHTNVITFGIRNWKSIFCCFYAAAKIRRRDFREVNTYWIVESWGDHFPTKLALKLSESDARTFKCSKCLSFWRKDWEKSVCRQIPTSGTNKRACVYVAENRDKLIQL